MEKNAFYRHFRQNTMFFIDASNLFYSQKSLRIEIDYKKLYILLSDYARSCWIFFYRATTGNPEEQKFIKKLEKTGYTIITKELKTIKTNKETILHKGNLDIELALDAFEKQDNYRTLVLISGDSDFATLFDRVRKNKKRCIFISTRWHAGRELFTSAHDFIDLKNLIPFIKKEPPNTVRGSITDIRQNRTGR